MKHTIFILLILSTCLKLFPASLPDHEKLTFEISYGVITAGEATLDLQKITYQGKDCWQIQVNAKTNSFFDKMFKVRDFIESISLYESFYSLRFTKKMQEGNYQQHRIHLNYLNLNKSVYQRYNYKNKTFNQNEMEIPSDTMDLMSAFYYSRTLDLQPDGYDGFNLTVDGKNYNAGVETIKRETIDTVLGKKSCLIIRPVLQGEAIFKQTGNIDIYVTDDEFKIPVMLSSKVIFGSFKATLKTIEKS